MTIKGYIDYWNQWQAEWYRVAIENSSEEKTSNSITVEGWPLLGVNGSNNNSVKVQPSWKFFPEPYWGIPDSNNLNGVFINFNPGEGQLAQHINTAIEYSSIKKSNLNHRIWEKFPEQNYYETIKKLYSEDDYMTTNWMRKKRESFIHNYINTFDKDKEHNGDFVMFELCPWHTKSVTNKVYKYIKDNLRLIDEYIIDFAIESAKTVEGTFNNLILTHGLDKKIVENNINTLECFAKEEINNDSLKKPWTIDVFTKAGSNVYLLNFKNSSNGFPVISTELKKIIVKYRGIIEKN